MSQILEIIIFLPIIAALAIGLGAPARVTSLAAAWINLSLVLVLMSSYAPAASGEGYAFTSSRLVLENPVIAFAVGADGLSLTMALLAALVTLAAVWQITDKSAIHHIAALLIAGGALGAFLCTDVFFIYAFHELALIPTFLMIALYGHGDSAQRRAVAWKITIYLGAGSLVLLGGLAALVLNFSEGPHLTFDLLALKAKAAAAPLPQGAQAAIFFVLLLGFGALVSLFPFHSWAAPAYATAPTSVAMLHSGVLKKFGLYGLLRIALPLLPEGARAGWVQEALLLMLLGNILVMGLVTIHQSRLDDMLANSSVMHMGYIFLGIAAGTEAALKGAIILMFAHGVSIALLFALCGRMRKQVGTLELAKLGGLAQNAPFLTLVFAFGAFASIGLPGLANFAGEFMVFAGAFDIKSLPATGLGPLQWATILALWGVVMSAVYMLRAYRQIFFGSSASGLHMCDPSAGSRVPLVLLAAVLLIVGCCPGLILDLLKTAWGAAKTAGV